MKDASILARIEDPALRRAWRQRIVDHDGDARGRRRHRPLAEAHRRARPRPRRGRLDARRSCPARASPSTPMSISCASAPCSEAIASSLTELFSPKVIADPRPGHAGELRLRHAGDARLFHRAPRAGAARRRLRARLRAGARNDARRRRSRCCRRSSSNATCSGRCSTRFTTPMSSPGTCRPAPGSRRGDGACGRCPAAPRPRRPPAARTRPAAASSCSRPSGCCTRTAPRSRCCGSATASARSRRIVDELAARFAADRGRIAAEVAALLTDLAAKRMVEL